MDDRQYKELLMEIQGKDLRALEAEEILRELLNGEFREIQQRKFKIRIERLGRDIAKTFTSGDTVYISISLDFWEQNPNFGKAGLRSVLKHELLHVETGLKDHDPRFKAEARKRKIDIWYV